MTTIDAAPLSRTPRLPLSAFLSAILLGVAFDRFAVHGPATVAGMLLVSGAGFAVALLPRGGALSARALGLVAAVLGIALVIRSGPVAALALLAAMAAITLSVVAHRGGSVFDTTIPRLVVRGLSAAYDAIRLPAPVAAWLADARDRVIASPDRRRRASSYARGVVLAGGIALLVVPLLAAGDAVFAALVTFDVDLGPVPGHLVIVAIGAGVAGGMLYAASRSEPVLDLPAGPTLGTAECRIVLATLATVYAAFAGGRVVAALGGADRVLETSGLTYAEYARTGFFQLLGAVAVTVVVLLGVRGMRGRDAAADRWVTALSVTVAVLTLVCAATAVQRLALYENAFGLTLLRLLALVSAGWLALLLVLVVASVSGVAADRDWLPGTIAVSLLAVVVVLAVVNPEAVVVRRNVDRAVAGGSFDAAYAASLSVDATPTIVAQLDRLGAPDRAAVVQRLCELRDDNDVGDGLGWNLGRRRAADALASVC
ncbi:MAG TPA: DUF4153 domain-containing protein [Mycobacteriales bacterium]|nr:DUF4153 domain-containing protein [Mycobacteriales bacterium]